MLCGAKLDLDLTSISYLQLPLQGFIYNESGVATKMPVKDRKSVV